MSVVAVGDGACVYLDLLPCKCTHIHSCQQVHGDHSLDRHCEKN